MYIHILKFKCNKLKHIHELKHPVAHMSVFVCSIIGQFQFLEGYGLPQKLLNRERGIGVNVESPRGWGVCPTGHLPTGPMIGIPVPSAIHRYDIHGNQKVEERMDR